jgi:hypothetical protein
MTPVRKPIRDRITAINGGSPAVVEIYTHYGAGSPHRGGGTRSRLKVKAGFAADDDVGWPMQDFRRPKELDPVPDFAGLTPRRIIPAASDRFTYNYLRRQWWVLEVQPARHWQFFAGRLEDLAVLAACFEWPPVPGLPSPSAAWWGRLAAANCGRSETQGPS